MLAHCAGTALHLQCSTFQHSSQQTRNIVHHLSSSSSVLLSLVLSTSPQLLSVLAVSTVPRGVGVGVTERERWEEVVVVVAVVVLV